MGLIVKNIEFGELLVDTHRWLPAWNTRHMELGMRLCFQLESSFEFIFQMYLLLDSGRISIVAFTGVLGLIHIHKSSLNAIYQ